MENLEIITAQVEYKKVEVQCEHCKTTHEREWVFGMLKNVFYCQKCWVDLPYINNAIDNKFVKLEKQTDELLNGAVEKGKTIRNLTQKVDELETKLKQLYEFIELIVKQAQTTEAEEKQTPIKKSNKK